MKSKYLIAGAIALLASSAFAMSRGPQELNGIYVTHHPITIPNDDYTDEEVANADDALTIRNDDGGGFDFHAELTFDYGHTCDMEGSAHVTKRSAFGGTWYFRYTQPEAEKLTKQCVLDFKVTQDSIELLDPKMSCTDWCGARGYFDQASFKRESKRPLKD